MAIDKSKWNKNIKVSQKTIDEIKKMGMTKALKTVAGASAASKIGDASAKEWAEGVKRLYTAERVAKVMPSISGSSQARPLNRVVPTKKSDVKPKGKSSSTAKKLQTAGLAAATIASLVATRGRANPIAAAKLAPGFTRSSVGKAILGNTPKAYPKAPAEGVRVGAKGSFGKTTSATAKGMAKGTKKVGTKAEFANKATEESVRAGLAARAARVKTEGVTVGPRGTFGKTTSKAKKATPANKKGKK